MNLLLLLLLIILLLQNVFVLLFLVLREFHKIERVRPLFLSLLLIFFERLQSLFHRLLFIALFLHKRSFSNDSVELFVVHVKLVSVVIEERHWKEFFPTTDLLTLA